MSNKKIIIISLSIIFIIMLCCVSCHTPKPKLWLTYTVKPGDTLYNISNDITPNDKDYRDILYYIQQENDLKNSTIYIGQTIKVPILN